MFGSARPLSQVARRQLDVAYDHELPCRGPKVAVHVGGSDDRKQSLLITDQDRPLLVERIQRVFDLRAGSDEGQVFKEIADRVGQRAVLPAYDAEVQRK
ncbi:DUF294 nucleotidyltransferase-like domain-containing protein [Micromonospora sp. C95]|uniref:DUF294 nucleotidyltransferase-like domain-containing protein n=1 Tax=Micromonospora sp. C95 TaxID=2824882 RepID=UPI0035B35CA3